MRMATLEFIQSSTLTAPDVLFGDFSESEVASIIYKSSLFNKHHDPICFGTFTVEEVLEMLGASHSQSRYVTFDFDEISSKPKKSIESSPGSAEKEVPSNGDPIAPLPQLHQPNTVPNGDTLNFQTSDQTDIDAVLNLLIDETVKSSLVPLQQSPIQNNFQYSPTQPPTGWSNGNHQQMWSPNNNNKNNNNNHYSNFYQTSDQTQRIWSQGADAKTPTLWSNGNQWSSLFKSNKDPIASPQIMPSVAPVPNIPLHHPQILSENIPVSAKDHELMMLGSQLQLMTIPHHKLVDIVPRGLINKSTNCFAHAPLQALLVSPLYHIIQQLDSSYTLSPVLSAMKQFFSSFTVATGIVDKMDPPFEPTCVYEMLRNKMPTFNENGRQEDAEEFLGIILSHLHDEMVSAVKSSKKTVSLSQTVLIDQDDGEWQQMGKKNKIQVTRNTSNNESSPVSELFGGLTRSVVSKAGAKESATLQPFLSLQLDIQHQQIHDVQDALAHFTHREQIQLNEAKCYRQETLESLPPVLILHLKRFIFDDAAKSCQKLHKEINFNVNLGIDKDMMSAVGTSVGTERMYKLFGVVYHHGSHAAGGHYSAMVYHPYIQCWIYCDDDKVTHQDDKAVLKHVPGRSAYLLFYKREA